MRAVYAAAILGILIVLGLAAGRSLLPTSDSRRDERVTLEERVLRLVNDYRQSQGRRPLQPRRTIGAEAVQHSRRMARGEVPVGHQGFRRRIRTIGQEIPYRAAAENVGFNEGFADPARQVVEGWIGSPEHRANLLGSYELTGVGVARSEQGAYYFTQIYLQPRR